jgi:hypothetical protein
MSRAFNSLTAMGLEHARAVPEGALAVQLRRQDHARPGIASLRAANERERRLNKWCTFLQPQSGQDYNRYTPYSFSRILRQLARNG